MAFTSINPANGETLASYDEWSDARLEQALELGAKAGPAWRARSLAERVQFLLRLGEAIDANADKLATLMSQEMGKIITEARGEVAKCALLCRYYAEHAEAFLADEPAETDAGKSYVTYQPLGAVLGIMPWNFPLWQVIRFAAPALTVGNTGLLKHADNVPGCALAIEELFLEAGYPEGVFQTLMISIPTVDSIIGDPRISAVTLTGSERAGEVVAAEAGRHLKKTVLELGGSDPFIVLDDADLDAAVAVAVQSRYLNAGQSCIAAKRFIVLDAVADDFVARLRAKVETLEPGDPLAPETNFGPMARADLREALHAQVSDALAKGARAVTGCEAVPGDGYYYQASILDGIKPGMRAWQEEVFGPVASIIRVPDEAEALRVANGVTFGLGGSVWTRDKARGERVALALECGSAFVNGLVKSDPRLPFGGTKRSGYGRELALHGIREFVNVKTIWIA